MRTTELARAAAEAEALRWKRLVRRQVFRAVYGVIALVFLIAVLVVLHALAYVGLSYYFEDIYALLIVLAGDFVLLVIFGLLAAISHPGAVEREALQIRQTATAQLKSTVRTGMALRPLLRLLPGRYLYSLVLAGLTARHITRR